MSDQVEPASGANEQALHAEITRLNKIIQSLMNRAERNASIQGSDFNLFQTAITLEDQVRRRTDELDAVLRENEKITRALRERENNYRLLLENSPVSIHEIDMDGRIISMSRAGILMHGFKGEGEIQGSLYLDGVSNADRERIGELLAKAYAGETSHFEFVASGSREQIYKSCFVPIMNNSGNVEKLMGITEDITERKKAEEQVRQFAFYDTLTRLPNRRLLNDRLGQAMSACKRSGRYGAVMFLDLDNFKPLNDARGHDVGDLLLIEVAHRITGCVREMDTVARFGGDEFVVMLSELDVNKERSVALAGMVAEKIRVTLAGPYLLTRKQEGYAATTVEHHCTSSIGVVLFSNYEASQEDIIKRADMAMYQAKDGGRNIIRFFDGQP
jgi:diguanylate cyclase (GGDEF)-like protein/PAS domain S-box-containing protein